MTRLIYAMHHAPASKREGQIVGSRTDLPLSTYGVKTARRMATWLRDGMELGTLPLFRRVITSPLLRAQQTAVVLGQECGLEITIDERLSAQDFGALDGMTFDEIRANPELRGNLWEAIPLELRQQHTPPGAESNGAFVERIILAKATMEQTGAEGLHILHGTVIDALIAIVQQRPLHEIEGKNRAYEGRLLAFVADRYFAVADSLAPVSHIPHIDSATAEAREELISRYVGNCDCPDERIHLRKLIAHFDRADEGGIE